MPRSFVFAVAVAAISLSKLMDIHPLRSQPKRCCEVMLSETFRSSPLPTNLPIAVSSSKDVSQSGRDSRTQKASA